MSYPDIEVQTVELLADWIETTLLVSSPGSLSLERLFAMAEEDLNVSSDRASMAVTVMDRRRQVLGDLYPFKVVRGIAVKHVGTAPLTLAYKSLLFLTPGSLARQLLGDLHIGDMGNLLEDVAESALQSFWGTGGRAIRFGFPSRWDRPREFDQAVVWLARRIGLEPGRGYRPPRRRDGGVDVVAWRPFLDGRSGFPIALAQCTIQAETFTKTTDVDTRLWSSWLAMDTDPLSILVIPSTIRRAGPEWNQLSTVVTVVDRIRLIELLGRGGSTEVDYTWTVDTEARLRDSLDAG